MCSLASIIPYRISTTRSDGKANSVDNYGASFRGFGRYQNTRVVHAPQDFIAACGHKDTGRLRRTGTGRFGRIIFKMAHNEFRNAVRTPNILHLSPSGHIITLSRLQVVASPIKDSLLLCGNRAAIPKIRHPRVRAHENLHIVVNFKGGRRRRTVLEDARDFFGKLDSPGHRRDYFWFLRRKTRGARGGR